MIRRSAAVLLLTLAPRAALGADAPEPKVAVLDVRAADPSLQGAADSARIALARALRRHRVRVVEEHPVVVAAHSQESQAAAESALARAQAHVKEGTRLFERQDPAGAEREFRLATGLFEANAGWLSRSDDLVSSYLFLAQIFFATQRELAVREVFRRVVQLAPDLTLDRARFPSALIALHDEVRGQLVAGPLGSLSIDSEPSPAQVFFDGAERGVTPMEVVNVPPGVHSLKIVRPGYVSHVQPIEVVSYRVDRVTARLDVQRHPQLAAAFGPRGAPFVSEYLRDVSERAGLDLAIVGVLTRGPEGPQLQVRSFQRGGGLGAVRTGTAKTVEALAQQILVDAAEKGWIPPLAARRNVSAGGGALDAGAPWAVTAAVLPQARIAGASRSFPRTPSLGARVGIDRRLLPALVVFGATGLEVQAQSGITLRDSSGAPLPGNEDGVSAIYTSVPFELGARGYGGHGVLAPYVVGSAELRLDMISWRDRLPNDSLRSNPGLGYAASLGAGAERVLDTRSAVFAEARLQAGRVGVRSATLRTNSYEPRRIPIDAGTVVGVRVHLGYRKVF